MNWEALGAIGELVGAVAVIVTLVYLAAQIRQNNRSLTGATLNAITEHQQYELRWSTEIGDAFQKAMRSPESMSESETWEVSEWTTAAILARQNEYFQYRHGLLLEENWQACKKIIPIILGPAWFHNWWEVYGKETMSDEFVERVEEILAESQFDLEEALQNMKMKGDA